MGSRALGLVGLLPSKPPSVLSSRTCLLLCESVHALVCVLGAPLPHSL